MSSEQRIKQAWQEAGRPKHPRGLLRREGVAGMKRYRVRVGSEQTSPLIETDCPNRAADIADLISLPSYMEDGQTGQIVYRNAQARKKER